KGAQLLVRVLGRDHEEWLGQRIRGEVGAYLALLHRLEQRALGTRTGAIDLVRQQELGEDRPLAEVKLLRGPVEDGHADDVGRQQVAGELHTMPGQAQHMSQRVGASGLSHTRDVLDEQVPPRQQTGQAEAHLGGLAEDDGLEGSHGVLQRRRVGFYRGQGIHDYSIPRRRASCALMLLTWRSKSAWRSRSVATTSGGALRTKFSFDSFTRVLANSCSALAASLVRRSISAATSMSPAMGTSSVSSPMSAVAD